MARAEGFKSRAQEIRQQSFNFSIDHAFYLSCEPKTLDISDCKTRTPETSEPK